MIARRSQLPTAVRIRVWLSMPCARLRSWPEISMRALKGRDPQPFVYRTLGMMGSLGHSKAFGQLLKVRLRGFPAWFVRRTYYLLQMPGWGRRLRIMIDWTFALLFRPDIVKISLDSETALLLREVVATDLGLQKRGDNFNEAGAEMIEKSFWKSTLPR